MSLVSNFIGGISSVGVGGLNPSQNLDLNDSTFSDLLEKQMEVKPKEENNLKNIVKVVNKQPTTKKNNYIPSTTKEVITTTKNTIQDQPKEKHISYIYLLLIPILIILYIFIRKNKI